MFKVSPEDLKRAIHESRKPFRAGFSCTIRSQLHSIQTKHRWPPCLALHTGAVKAVCRAPPEPKPTTSAGLCPLLPINPCASLQDYQNRSFCLSLPVPSPGNASYSWPSPHYLGYPH